MQQIMPPEVDLDMSSPLDPTYSALKDLVVGATGLAYYNERDDLLTERLQRRLSARGIDNYADYLGLIRSDRGAEAEFEDLVADLTIGETCFFRDAGQFAALRDHILPECFARNAGRRRVKIWSAGCSTGAEAYSIAILLEDMLQERVADWQITILGTDINRSFLEQAGNALFGDWTVRNVSEALRRRCFSRSGRHWRLADRFRRHVSFLHHNLAEGRFPPLADGLSDFDVVLCRNVMIYFSDETNRSLIDRFERSIRPGGWLLVGPAEVSFYLNERFEPVSMEGAHAHRKRPEEPGAARVAPSAANPAPANGCARDETGPQKAIVFSHLPDVGPGQAPGDVAAPPSPAPGRPSRARHDEAAAAAPSHRSRPAAKTAAATSERSSFADVVASADRGAWPAVVERCRARLRADPFDPGTYYYLAIGLQGQGSSSEAEDALKRALYLDRNLAIAHHQLALLRKQAGDVAGSEKFLRNAHRILEQLDDTCVVSFCNQVTARDLRKIVVLQLERLAGS